MRKMDTYPIPLEVSPSMTAAKGKLIGCELPAAPIRRGGYVLGLTCCHCAYNSEQLRNAI
jgi:hypothetical protein